MSHPPFLDGTPSLKLDLPTLLREPPSDPLVATDNNLYRGEFDTSDTDRAGMYAALGAGKTWQIDGTWNVNMVDSPSPGDTIVSSGSFTFTGIFSTEDSFDCLRLGCLYGRLRVPQLSDDVQVDPPTVKTVGTTLFTPAVGSPVTSDVTGEASISQAFAYLSRRDYNVPRLGFLLAVPIGVTSLGNFPAMVSAGFISSTSIGWTFIDSELEEGLSGATGSFGGVVMQSSALQWNVSDSNGDRSMTAALVLN